MTELTSGVLDTLKNSINQTEIVKNEAYYRGKNPPILGERKKRRPDNKIPVALGYRLISNLTGFAGKSGDIFINQVPEEGVDTNKSDFEQIRQEIDTENNAFLLNSLLYAETLKQGISYDVVWTEQNEKTKDLTIKFAQIPNHQAVPVWSSTLETVKTMERFVRFWDDSVIIGTEEANTLGILEGENGKDGKSIVVSFAQAFEVGGYQKYYKPEKSKKWFKLGEFIPQPFSRIQVNAYRANFAASAYIEPVMVLIDQMDKVISRNLNETERFNNSILAVMKQIDPIVKGKIEELGVMDDLISGLEEHSGDLFPKFIERNVPTEHAKLMLDSLSDKIYQIMGSVDFSSESFGTASGIALLYRLIGLEYSASEIDNWYDKGLHNRNLLINEALESSLSKKEIGKGFTPVIVHHRNVPVDVSFLAESALKLKGAGVSMETILKLFPKSIINDVNAELERIEANKPIGLLDEGLEE